MRPAAALLALTALTACGGTTVSYQDALQIGPGRAEFDFESGTLSLDGMIVDQPGAEGVVRQSVRGRTFFTGNHLVSTNFNRDVTAATIARISQTDGRDGTVLHRNARTPDLPDDGRVQYIGSYHGQLNLYTGTGGLTVSPRLAAIEGSAVIFADFDTNRVSGRIEDREAYTNDGRPVASLFLANTVFFDAVPIQDGGTFAATTRGGAFDDGTGGITVGTGELRGLIAGEDGRTIAGALRLGHNFGEDGFNEVTEIETGVFVAEDN